MMFLDGCFILQFIDSIFNGKIEGMMKRNIAAYVRRDFLLLENQLPYQALEVLMGLRFKDRKGDEVMNQFIDSIRQGVRRKLREEQTGHSVRNKEENKNQPVHLLDLFQRRFIDEGARTSKRKPRDWYSYPAVKELKTLGICFRPSRGDRFTDIKYITCGKLCLPELIIDDTTKSLLLNLVAYEACPEGPDCCGITSYVCFMDSLIDQAKYVKQLRSKEIIYNILGSDQQAADLFNEIAKDIVPNLKAFTDVKEDIEQHCKCICKTWIAECLHNHFSSPWKFFAFLAATFALLLTDLQTYLSLIDHCSGTGKQKHDFLSVLVPKVLLVLLILLTAILVGSIFIFCSVKAWSRALY